jgi:hypothetical protein
MNRAKLSGIKLTISDVRLVKGMLHRGDRQHDIASWFGVNGGRIAEISTRAKHSDIIMQKERLPPAGPYISGKKSYEAKVSLENVSTEIKELITNKMDEVTRLNLGEIIKKIDIIITEI